MENCRQVMVHEGHWKCKNKIILANEPHRDKTNKMSVRPAKTQISLGIRPIWSVLAVRLIGSQVPKLSSSGQWRRWSDWADAQADLSLRWAHMPFSWFCQDAAQISSTTASQDAFSHTHLNVVIKVYQNATSVPRARELIVVLLSCVKKVGFKIKT